MRKLRSFKNTFIQYGILHSNNQFDLRRKSLLIDDIKNMDGVFDYINNEIFAIGLNSSDNFVYYKGQTKLLSSEFQLKYQRLDQETCQLQIMDNSKLIIDLVYNQKDYGVIDRIGVTEIEMDYNFGVWLYCYFEKINRGNSD